ncbi:hypothetical protein Tco_0932712, partial [Tanacetum coccineum]
MDRLPSNIILDIIPSNIWPVLVVEPTPILYHPNLSRERICFHVIESKQPGTTHYVLEPKEGPFLEYLRKEPLSRSSIFNIQVQGSCNGMMCILQDDGYVITSLAVVHPLRKECYELPPFPFRFDRPMLKESCGLGFDTSTNTWKMVCVLLKEYAPPDKPDMVKKNLCTMVHVFGTNSWREIPQVPSYPISGKAVFANGCLHWLASYSDIKTKDGRRPVIWYQVVDLNGEVGYVCARTMEVWLLNHKKEWVPHCRFKEEIVPHGYIDVIGCWNKDGDILIRSICGNPLYAFYVYNLKSGALHKTNLVGSVGCPAITLPLDTCPIVEVITSQRMGSRPEKVKLQKGGKNSNCSITMVGTRNTGIEPVVEAHVQNWVTNQIDDHLARFRKEITVTIQNAIATTLSGLSMDTLRRNGEGTSRGTQPQFTRMTKIEFPKFGGEDVRGWLYKCEQFFEIDQVSDPHKVQLASIHLYDTASLWHRQFVKLMGENASWNSFKEAILLRFGSAYDAYMKEMIEVENRIVEDVVVETV